MLKGVEKHPLVFAVLETLSHYVTKQLWVSKGTSRDIYPPLDAYAGLQ